MMATRPHTDETHTNETQINETQINETQINETCTTRQTINGGEASLVGRPGFKPGGWRHASPGGFDSHSPPPMLSTR